MMDKIEGTVRTFILSFLKAGLYAILAISIIGIMGVPMACFIRWKDGLIFQIDKVLYKCRATSKKVGGGGIRYTVLIRGKESFLFHEGDKWFVEAKEGCS